MSDFGSHQGMIVRVTSEQWATGRVTCRDSYGEYETEKWRIDSGLADPHRNDLASRGVL